MKHFQQIITLLGLACVVWFAVDAATRTIEARLEEVPAGRQVASGAAGPGSAGPKPVEQYMPIAERNLFGGGEILDVFKKSPTPPPPPPPPGLTQLGLKLVGTVPSIDGVPGWAIIRKGPAETIYREGAAFDGLTLKKINRKSVVFILNGQDETLSMEVDTREIPPAVADLHSPPPPQIVRLKKQDVEDAIKNWNETISGVRVRPMAKGNPAAGYHLLGVTSFGFLSRLGLTNNDVIMGFNNQPLTGMKQIMDHYKNIPPGGSADLKIKRNGADQTIKYEME